MNDKKKAWMNVIGAMVVLASVYGCVINSFTLFVVPISTERRIPREYVSLILTIMFLSYMLSSSLSGKIYEKVRVKSAMMVAAVLVPLFYFSLSFPLPLPLMYFSSLIVGLLLPFISFTAFSILIRSWFPDNTGFATGIAFMGSGIGGMIWSVVLGSIIENRGYQAAYGCAGIVMIAIAIVVCFFLIDDSKVVIEKREGKSKFIKPEGLGNALILSFLVGITPLFVSQAMVPKALDAGMGGS
ncbi:MAG: MFS transporter, partial [Candidatus Ornithospirochaeta sp.]